MLRFCESQHQSKICDSFSQDFQLLFTAVSELTLYIENQNILEKKRLLAKFHLGCLKMRLDNFEQTHLVSANLLLYEVLNHPHSSSKLKALAKYKIAELRYIDVKIGLRTNAYFLSYLFICYQFLLRSP